MKTKLTLFVTVIAITLFGMGCASTGNTKTNLGSSAGSSNLEKKLEDTARNANAGREALDKRIKELDAKIDAVSRNANAGREALDKRVKKLENKN